MTALDYRAAVVDDLAQEIGETCKDKGFREDWETADDLENLALHLREQGLGENVFISSPGEDGEVEETIEQFLFRAANTLRNCVIGTKLALVCSEVGEALETLRDHGVEGVMAGEGNFGEELSDAQIRILEMGDLLSMSLGSSTVTKMEKNSTRPHRHGRKF